MEAVKAVSVFPRRRDPDPTGPTKQKVKITIDDILARADMSLSEAALSLGISVTTLKKACRLLGVAKWPYTRRGTSYSKSLSKRRKIQAKPQAKSSCESPLSFEVESPVSFLDRTMPFWDATLWNVDTAWDATLWNVDTALPEVPAEGCDLWFLCATMYAAGIDPMCM